MISAPVGFIVQALFVQQEYPLSMGYLVRRTGCPVLGRVTHALAQLQLRACDVAAFCHELAQNLIELLGIWMDCTCSIGFETQGGPDFILGLD